MCIENNITHIQYTSQFKYQTGYVSNNKMEEITMLTIAATKDMKKQILNTRIKVIK